MKYPIIYADPPWSYRVWSAKGGNKSASAHYDVQSADWIAGLPVADAAADDCALFLWATWPNLAEAMRVIDAWGFEYKTLAFDWIKLYSSGMPRMGLGYYTRSNSEPCLLATRGNPKRVSKSVHQIIESEGGDVIECPIGRHSAKPEEVYRRIEALMEGPYLEMFHRPKDGLFPPRPNWTFLGNEATGRDMAEDLRIVAATPDKALLEVM